MFFSVNIFRVFMKEISRFLQPTSTICSAMIMIPQTSVEYQLGQTEYCTGLEGCQVCTLYNLLCIL